MFLMIYMILSYRQYGIASSIASIYKNSSLRKVEEKGVKGNGRSDALNNVGVRSRTVPRVNYRTQYNSERPENK